MNIDCQLTASPNKIWHQTWGILADMLDVVRVVQQPKATHLARGQIKHGLLNSKPQIA